jgi:FkbM family methyltransferase
MDFSRISSKGLAGKVMRQPLKLIPKSARMPILQGRLRGKKWIAGSSTNHGFWLGTREHKQRKIFEDTVTEGSVIYDVGGHVGFYSLLASVITGPGGNVFTFEPFESNLIFLKEHLRINEVENVTLYEAAVTDKPGKAFFAPGIGSFDGRLSADGRIEVEAVALDALIQQGELPPADFIKMDIEGGEVAALAGARKLLEERHPTIFLATHGRDIHARCIDMLESLDYKLLFTDDKPRELSSEVLATYNN